MGHLGPPIVTRSVLEADLADVWARITTVDGINDELRPLLRMTAPARLKERGLSDVVVGQRICRSWVLLFGLVPVDYDDITLERLDPPRGFLERSTMLSQRRWEHERTLDPGPGGCVITDRIRYQPRVPVPDAILRPLYTRIFRHRHHGLHRRYGGRFLAGQDPDAPGPRAET
jgi:ligand-binding SRPBCC domain-containing protein